LQNTNKQQTLYVETSKVRQREGDKLFKKQKNSSQQKIVTKAEQERSKYESSKME